LSPLRLRAAQSSVVRQNSDGNHRQKESGKDEQYDVDLRRAVGRRFHGLAAAVSLTVAGDRSRSHRRRRPRHVHGGGGGSGGRLKPGGGVDGACLEVGAAVTPTTAGRRRPPGRTAPVLDALRLRLVGWTRNANADDRELSDMRVLSRQRAISQATKQKKNFRFIGINWKAPVGQFLLS